jgi:hypothetical protein
MFPLRDSVSPWWILPEFSGMTAATAKAIYNR